MNRNISAPLSTTLIFGFILNFSAYALDPCAGVDANGLRTQKPSYCAARDTANNAANASQRSAMLWTAVAGVCIASCAMTWAGGDRYCAMGQMSVGVIDGLLANDIASGAMGVMSGFMNLQSLKGASPREAKNSACMAAGMATLSAVGKFQAAGQQRSSADQLNQEAANLDTTATTLPNGSVRTPAFNGTNFTGTVPKSNVEAATAADPSLPGFINSDAFKKDFQKLAGVSLEDFSKLNKAPSDAIGGVAGGALSNSQAEKLHDLVAEAEKRADAEGITAGHYAKQGGDSGAASDLNTNDLLATFMKQAGGGEASANGKVQAMNLSAKTRSPAGQVDDPSVSIFERVSKKYKDWTSVTFKN